MQEENFKKIMFRIFVGIGIIFVLITFNVFHLRDFLKGKIQYYFTPVLAHSSQNGSKFSKTLDLVFSLPSLRDEIEKDKEKIFNLEAQNAKLRLLEKENKKLRQLLELPVSKNVKKNVADVISKDFEAQDWLLIDKGTSSGVSEGDIVLSAQNALVGFVYKVNNHSAYVRLTTSEKSVFRVVLAGKDVIALAKGSHGNSIEVEYVDLLTDINNGDVFLYDNTDNKDVFLQKPAVGTVQDVTVSQDKLSRSVQLTPLYDINSLTSVVIFHSDLAGS